MTGSIIERDLVVDGIRIFCRDRGGSGTPVIFVHGNPTSSTDWVPFLDRLDGPAIAFDLPGFGRSERPDPTRFDHSIEAYATLLDHLLELLAADRFKLVVHDWGAIGLIAALRRPERIERLVLVNSVPLVRGYRWHWLARIWRRRPLGELCNAITTRFAMAQLLRLARPGLRPMPRGFVDAAWRAWDAGTRRAVLGLYRSGDPERLVAAASRLGEVDAPALIVWGVEDPYIGRRFARAHAEALADAEVLEVERAGHWPWIDRPELIGRIVRFLEPPAQPPET